MIRQLALTNEVLIENGSVTTLGDLLKGDHLDIISMPYSITDLYVQPNDHLVIQGVRKIALEGYRILGVISCYSLDDDIIVSGYTVYGADNTTLIIKLYNPTDKELGTTVRFTVLYIKTKGENE